MQHIYQQSAFMSRVCYFIISLRNKKTRTRSNSWTEFPVQSMRNTAFVTEEKQNNNIIMPIKWLSFVLPFCTFFIIRLSISQIDTKWHKKPVKFRKNDIGFKCSFIHFCRHPPRAKKKNYILTLHMFIVFREIVCL